MQWSMPHRVLQGVAALIALVALSAFTLGVVNAPQRGRMPGERMAGTPSGAAAPLAATDATPLGADRIEGLAPRELTPEEKEKLQEAKEAKEEADAEARAAAATAAPPTATAQAAAPPAAAAEAPPAPSPEEAPH